jgi:hypothetical protein
MQRSKSLSRAAAGDLSLHAPLLSTSTAATRHGDLEAADETKAACDSAADVPGCRHVSIACRLLPPCAWASCTFALSVFTQSVCQRPLFNFHFVITAYNNGLIDALATILNCLALSSVLLAAAAVAAAALCSISSDFAM